MKEFILTIIKTTIGIMLTSLGCLAFLILLVGFSAHTDLDIFEKSICQTEWEPLHFFRDSKIHIKCWDATGSEEITWDELQQLRSKVK